MHENIRPALQVHAKSLLVGLLTAHWLKQVTWQAQSQEHINSASLAEEPAESHGKGYEYREKRSI